MNMPAAFNDDHEQYAVVGMDETSEEQAREDKEEKQPATDNSPEAVEARREMFKGFGWPTS